MTTKRELVEAIKTHKDEIEKLLSDYNGQIAFAVYDNLDRMGNCWYTIKGEINSVRDLIEAIAFDRLMSYDIWRKKICDWSSIKSWSLLIEGEHLCKDYFGNLKNVKSSYGYIGIIDAVCADWEWFDEEPKHLREVYSLTGSGYDIFSSWRNGLLYEDFDKSQILEALTLDEIYSKKVGHFIYD